MPKRPGGMPKRSAGMRAPACGMPKRSAGMLDRKPGVWPTLIASGLALCCGCRAPQETLHVATLNLAHGRGVKVNPLGQVGLSRATFEQNLGTIADCLKREASDVVALQEADAASDWSGDFDHVAFLAQAAGYPYRFHGLHVDFEQGGLDVRYGTALLARRELTGAYAFDLAGKPLDTTKGFVAAEVEFAGRPVVVVSVHLHSKLASARRKQARALIDRFRPGGMPERSGGMAKRSAAMLDHKPALVIMGDCNSTWAKTDDAVRMIAEGLNLRAYDPDSEARNTYPAFDPRMRIDWILISDQLEFRDYHCRPEQLSDHLAVAAELAWR